MEEKKIQIESGKDQIVKIMFNGEIVSIITVWAEMSPEEKATVQVHATSVKRISVCVKNPLITKNSIDGSVERHEWISIKEKRE